MPLGKAELLLMPEPPLTLPTFNLWLAWHYVHYPPPPPPHDFDQDRFCRRCGKCALDIHADRLPCILEKHDAKPR